MRQDIPVPFRLMDLPAELREKIFAFVVTTEWAITKDPFAHINGTPPRTAFVEQQMPIFIDRLNMPAAPAITLVSRQVRAETLPLYYELNVFECWRPFKCVDPSSSTFIQWLRSLGESAKWLKRINLLYKHQRELDDYDVHIAIGENGLNITAKIFNKFWTAWRTTWVSFNNDPAFDAPLQNETPGRS